jgi:membrane-bound PQQ-dependent dehydrogenase (glucose/quinate/shikimate family)
MPKLLNSIRNFPFFSLIFISLGLFFTAGGLRLASTGGSLYYLISGIGLILTGYGILKKHTKVVYIYSAVIIFTILWAIWEVGLQPWGLLPRISGPSILGLYFIFPVVRKNLKITVIGGTIMLASIFSSGALLYFSYERDSFSNIEPSNTEFSKPDSANQEWKSVGGDVNGKKFSFSDEIDKANISKLRLKWSYDVKDADFGDVKSIPDFASRITFENTPLNIRDGLYFCLGNNVVIALEAETGKRRWRFDPKVDATGAWSLTCRGLAYHQAAKGTGAVCESRLMMGTVDDRLAAIDLKTGALCKDFGANGFVDLKHGLGSIIPGYHYVTSPPTIIGDVVVVGERILDNQSTDTPSGVVRGFDVRTGRLLWAWDMLHQTATRQKFYPRSTPNAWGIFSADEQLGLVYIPTGSTTPDHFGAQRTADQDRYAASVVAVDAKTGDVRWSFQTVHHDLWDYDVAAQPSLADLNVSGNKIPAIFVATKRGEIFVLDRRDGRAIFPVTERAAPAGAVEDERLSPTQPYSTGFPSLAPRPLTEASMWGATPIDLLYCRIKFRQYAYQGQFTPPSTQGTIIYPSTPGVINWGGVSIDPIRQIMVVNSNNLASVVRLIKRTDADKMGIAPYVESVTSAGVHSETSNKEFYAQAGTPYAVTVPVFTSFLGFPCNAPPWGRLSAIDIKSRRLLWSQPLGTTSEVAPLGIALPTGIMTQGGAMTTTTGITFIGAAFESTFRAFDTMSGKLLWQSKLPAPGRATPMSYTSSTTGKQYVVVAAGGRSKFTRHPEAHISAFALPH